MANPMLQGKTLNQFAEDTAIGLGNVYQFSLNQVQINAQFQDQQRQSQQQIALLQHQQAATNSNVNTIASALGSIVWEMRNFANCVTRSIAPGLMSSIY